jgi:hypothetical protein
MEALRECFQNGKRLNAERRRRRRVCRQDGAGTRSSNLPPSENGQGIGMAGE